MKTFLNVPFEEKDKAKRLGAKWDFANKKWYWEGAISPNIKCFVKNKKTFEDRYSSALKKFKNKRSNHV